MQTPIIGLAHKVTGKAYSKETKTKIMNAILAAWIDSDLSFGELIYHVINPSFGDKRDIFKIKDEELVKLFVHNVRKFNEFGRFPVT